jgi:enamine deaminase RidA (YjgF/YER057c/UK114 family)
MDVDARLRELGIELPDPMGPGGNYVPAMLAGDLLFLSGMGPVRPGGGLVTGKVGDGGLDLDTARDAARLTGLQLLAALRAELGDLGRVRQVVRDGQLPTGFQPDPRRHRRLLGPARRRVR